MTLHWTRGAYGCWHARAWGCGLHILQLAPERWSWLVEVDGYVVSKGVASSFGAATERVASACVIVTDAIAA